ncbi:MAG TPA: DNA repair protein RadC [Firmicutes bacterium]|nr:DNA repair protein RadC [Bacillota bacterium]
MSGIGNDGHKKRLRQRFRRSGFTGFAEYEILEMLLGAVNVRKDTKQLSKELLKCFGTLRNVLDSRREDLLSCPGVGERTADLLLMIKELIIHYLHQNATSERVKVDSPDAVADFFRAWYGGRDNEIFCVLCLNGQNRILDIFQYQEGSVNYSYLYPRNIIRDVFNTGATGIILVHNHPSGISEPSRADIAFTEKLDQLCRELDIHLLDHLIICSDSFVSLKSKGLF